METIKIGKGNSKALHYACDTDDKMDLCVYVNGQKIKLEPSKSEKTENGNEHTFQLDEEMTEELGEGKFKYSIRVNGEPAEKGHIVIHNEDSDEETNED